MMSEQLPERLTVSPSIDPGGLRPDLEWDDRDQVIGHKVAAEAGGYLFEESRADHIFFHDYATARTWLRSHNYHRLRDLDNMAMADREFHGVWIRPMTEDEIGNDFKRFKQDAFFSAYE